MSSAVNPQPTCCRPSTWQRIPVWECGIAQSDRCHWSLEWVNVNCWRFYSLRTSPVAGAQERVEEDLPTSRRPHAAASLSLQHLPTVWSSHVTPAFRTAFPTHRLARQQRHGVHSYGIKCLRVPACCACACTVVQERVEEEPEQEVMAEEEEEEDLGPSIEELIERAQHEQVGLTAARPALHAWATGRAPLRPRVWWRG